MTEKLKKKILIVVGTRPNFIKITKFQSSISKFQNIELKVVHTGQHFDSAMSDIFFKQLNLTPDYFLNIKQSSPVEQMAEIMVKLQQLIQNQFNPDLMIVPGDVNSTLAAAITANKLNIKLAHLESGLRSFDRQMPEEHNRIIADQLSDYLFVTEKSGLKNIKNEHLTGVPFFVGNTMIDSIYQYQNQIDESDIIKKLNIKGKYAVFTIHRPSNVDKLDDLKKVVTLMKHLVSDYSIVFPIHPRTLSKLKEFKLYDDVILEERIILTEALGYFEFQNLIKNCQFILTDSGGIQEESTFYKVPCLTLRDNTERPITEELGTNTLVPFDLETIKRYINKIDDKNYKKGEVPELWDGNTTDRIVKIIAEKILID